MAHRIAGEERLYFIYILARGKHGTLYVGVSRDALGRTRQHREGKDGSFTSRYGVNKLVCFETFTDIRDAIRREKAIKKWPRAWKVNLIEASNPAWVDLYPGLSS
jgi:putative endonuclease